MKKRINGKKNEVKRKVIGLIVFFIFLFYICLSLSISERRYLFIESFFKNISSNINTFFINNMYSCSNVSENIINSKIKYLENENSKLKKTLDLKQEKSNYVPAKIVNHTSKAWFELVDIDVGYDKGISKNLPVVNSEGLIGFISKTSKNISEVKLLTSINENNLISVLIETDKSLIAGMLSDYSIKTGLFKITDVTSKENIVAGNDVVLSGYDNDSYKGIYIGKVVKEEVDNYGLSRTIWVESSVNFDDLMYVLVPVTKEEK